VGVILLSGNLSYYQEFHEISKKYQGIAYLSKGENPRNELVNTISHVLQGGVWVAPEIANYKINAHTDPLFEPEHEMVKNILSFFDDLSQREIEIIRLVAASYDNEDIAKLLTLSPNTVSSHLTKIYSKVGLGEFSGRSEKRALLSKAYLASKKLHNT
jgi:DNA-binding NarL/FixJ family response regulator